LLKEGPLQPHFQLPQLLVARASSQPLLMLSQHTCAMSILAKAPLSFAVLLLALS
jgi:hypothetical protein